MKKTVLITIVFFVTILLSVVLFAEDTVATSSAGAVDFLEAHWQDILMIFGAIYAAATALSGAFVLLSKLTPWQKDDIVAQAIAEFLVSLAKFAARFGIDLLKRK